jgi:membrane protein DedA with SNARE-associated domain
VVLLGYLAGASYRKLEHSFGQGTALAAAALVVVALAVWRIRGHRRRPRAAR